MLVKPRLQKCICSHYTGYYYMPTQKPYYRASVHGYKGCFWSDFCNGGLNGDVRPAQGMFFGIFVLNRVLNLSFFVLIRVSIYQFLS